MSDSLDAPVLRMAHCARCGAYSYPPEAWGCRACGAAADALDAVPCPETPRLKNFVTVHSELAPGLPVPCVIGEVALAPGVVEEALIGVADESGLRLDMPLRAEALVEDGRARWRFVPVAEGGAA
ncbi:MAG: hypothetical protein HY855_20800 [Burkholderiales bacterium]|nr:hypothetical protein [Burkholderiales bacterium]